MLSGTNGLFEKEGGGARAGSFFSSSLKAYNLFNENDMFELLDDRLKRPWLQEYRGVPVRFERGEGFLAMDGLTGVGTESIDLRIRVLGTRCRCTVRDR